MASKSGFTDEELLERFNEIYLNISEIKEQIKAVEAKMAFVEGSVGELKSNHADYLEFKRKAVEDFKTFDTRVTPLERIQMIEKAIMERRRSDLYLITKVVGILGAIASAMFAAWELFKH